MEAHKAFFLLGLILLSNLDILRKVPRHLLHSVLHPASAHLQASHPLGYLQAFSSRLTVGLGDGMRMFTEKKTRQQNSHETKHKGGEGEPFIISRAHLIFHTSTVLAGKLKGF